MEPIVKQHIFELNGIDAEYLYKTMEKICLAYDKAFLDGAPDEGEPNAYLLEFGINASDILREGIHYFLGMMDENKGTFKLDIIDIRDITNKTDILSEEK